MKRALTNLLFWGFLLGTATAEPDSPVQQLPLNPLAVASIPIGMNGATTIRFPSPVSDLEGAFISTDPNSPAPFLLSFHPGSAFFSVRARVPQARASLNVVWKEQTYVLELVESKKPWLSVVFMLSVTNSASSQVSHQPVTPSRLLGLLDTAKAYPLLKAQHPEALAGVDCVHTNTVNDYGDYTIKTEEVFRFDDADTLVFRIVVSNKTARLMRYLPQSLMVLAGQGVFYESITDAKGEVPPRASVPVYFAITGTKDGGRNDVSPRNDFLVLLNRLDPPPSSPTPSSAPTSVPPQTNSNAILFETPMKQPVQTRRWIAPRPCDSTGTSATAAAQPGGLGILGAGAEVKALSPLVWDTSLLKLPPEAATGLVGYTCSVQVQYFPGLSNGNQTIHYDYPTSAVSTVVKGPFNIQISVSPAGTLNIGIAHAP